MRRLFGCPDIVSLTEKFLMARNFYRIFTENNPVMGDSKTFGIPEVKGLKHYFSLPQVKIKNKKTSHLILEMSMNEVFIWLSGHRFIDREIFNG